jgi:hypothetical protein
MKASHKSLNQGHVKVRSNSSLDLGNAATLSDVEQMTWEWVDIFSVVVVVLVMLPRLGSSSCFSLVDLVISQDYSQI